MAAIKLFSALHKYFNEMGFHAPPQPNQACSFNAINLFYMIYVILMCIPIGGYFFFEASSGYEYANCFYVLITLLAMIVHFSVFYCKMGSFVALCENYAEFINKRKCR